jgi:hypothetical protein
MYIKRYLYDYRKLAASIGLVLSLFTPGAAGQMGLGLSPMRLELEALPGTQRTGSLTLSNDSKEEVRFRAEILDFMIDKEAIPQFEKDIPAESQYSCRQWLTFNPMEATIPAMGNLVVRYTLQVPPGLSARTYHCAGGFTSLAPIRQQHRQGIGMNTAVQVVAAFYPTIGKPAPEGELKQIAMQTINDPKSSGLRALFTVENSGLTNLRGLGSVEVLDSAGKTVETLAFPTAVILPRRTQLVPLVLNHKLAGGDYTIRARVNLGTGEIQEATLGFRPPPAR